MALRPISVLDIELPTNIFIMEECKCLWSSSRRGVSNKLLALSIAFHCHYYVWLVCVQLTHFSLCDWKYISIAHVIIIIKSDVSTLPIGTIFFPGCVPEMFVVLETEILVSLLLCSLWWIQIVGYAVACRLHSFVCTLHHLIIIV